jgi:putative phosphoesterase|tara:strand:+ start:107 stop:859 length:753 start_codon:yes stop_codon:yes gene_type:complete
MKILVISDIHGNAEALRAVIDAERDADHAVFLGDTVLAGPQANETMELLDELGPDVSIMGNHDEEVLDPTLIADWPKEWVAFNQWILDHLDDHVIERLRALRPAGRYELAGVVMYLHHGELEKSAKPALPDAPDDTFSMMDEGRECPLILFGHTHVQFERSIGAKTFINPGSVGQPRCGKMHACYGVFEDGRYSPRQVTYDPTPWLIALDRIDALDPYPKLREWLKKGLLTGYGIGEREPWTRYATEGFC